MLRRVGWLASIPLLVVACGGGGEPAVAPDVTFAAPPTADGSPPENAALPLTSLLVLSITDQNLLQRAAYTVTADCMAGRGFDYPAFEPIEHRPTDVDHAFGPWTEAEVPYFYGQDPSASKPHHSLWEQFTAALPPGEAQAWGEAYGDPRGARGPDVTLPDGTEADSSFSAGYLSGCAGQGLSAVYGDYAAREALREQIEDRGRNAFEAAEDADTVEQALAVWHDCMEAAGIDVASGSDGPQQLALRYVQAPGVSDEERQAAHLDIECKQRANLHDAFFAARADAEQREIDDNEQLVEAWRELGVDSLARAQDILAGDGGPSS